MKQWVSLDTDIAPGQRLFVQLCEIIRGNLDKLYSGMTIAATTVVRLTRDAEVEIDDDPAAGIRELVEEQVRHRRYEPVVRLEFGPGADPAIREMLRERFELSPADIYDMPEEVDYTTLFEIAASARFLSCVTRPGLLFAIHHFGKTGTRSLPPSRPATSLFIIRTTASKPAWNTSSAPLQMIPIRSRSR